MINRIVKTIKKKGNMFVFFKTTFQAIEASRAKIRSLSLFSPLETVLRKAISDYLCMSGFHNANSFSSSNTIIK